MKILHQFFIIPVQPTAEQEEALSSFIQQHSILTTHREFVSDAQNSFWAYDIEYSIQQKRIATVPPQAANSRPKVDYRETLSEQDFAKFSKLRELRKSCAHQEGLPVYAIFTNEHLAKMVQQKMTTSSAISSLEGVGKAKLEKYTELFLPMLSELFETLEPTPAPTTPPTSARTTTTSPDDTPEASS